MNSWVTVGMYQGERKGGTEGPRVVNSSAHSKDVQAQLSDMDILGTAQGNEVREVGRGQIVLSLVNVTKKPGLYLVRNRKLM